MSTVPRPGNLKTLSTLGPALAPSLSSLHQLMSPRHFGEALTTVHYRKGNGAAGKPLEGAAVSGGAEILTQGRSWAPERGS